LSVEASMTITRIVFGVFLATTLVACATSYQPTGFTGGFSDTQLAPDVFRVSFSGNGFTSPDRVQDFALLRAAELTLQHGARYFAVMDSENQSRTSTYVSPGSSYTSGTATAYGNTATYSGTTTSTPAQVHTYYKPGVGMVIRTFSQQPSHIHAFDAEFLLQSIRSKYGIE
jgi:hypothetical protein